MHNPDYTFPKAASARAVPMAPRGSYGAAGITTHYPHCCKKGQAALLQLL